MTSETASAPVRVAVIGARGKMGSQTCLAVQNAPDLQLGPQIDLRDDLSIVASADVAVVFSVPDVVVEHVLTCIRAGVHVVVGTTGWTPDRLAQIREALAEKPEVGVLIAPNFALGAVLLMRFAQAAAKHYESVEVIELHHPNKVDAPSGTAQHTATLIASARAEAGRAGSPDATSEGLEGARGASVEGVHVHSVRLRGLVAHEEVLFGNEGEQLSIRHDSFERASFMPGVLLGVRSVPSRPGLTVGLEHFLDV